MTYADKQAIAAHLRAVPRITRFEREAYSTLEPHSSEWLVKGLLPANGVGFLAGPSQSRKSFLALEWSLRVAGGDAILGHKTKQAGVVYVASEGASGVRKRVAAWRKHTGIAERAFDLVGQAPDLRNEVQVDDLIAILKEAADDHAANGERLGLVVIDTLAASMPGGSENDGADMSALIANVQRMGAEVGAFMLIVSHTGKDETRGLRGWSGQFAGADAVFMLTREEGSELSQGVVKKQKDGEDGERFAFRLEGVGLGFDDDGDEVGSAVVVYDDVPDAPTPRAKKLTAHAQKVFSAFGRLIDDQKDHPAPNVPGVKPGTRAVTIADLKSKSFELGLSAGQDPGPDATQPERTKYRNGRNVAFQRGFEALELTKLLRSEVGFVWEPR
jgi:putative DNA primase/helicase